MFYIEDFDCNNLEFKIRLVLVHLTGSDNILEAAILILKMVKVFYSRIAVMSAEKCELKALTAACEGHLNLIVRCNWLVHSWNTFKCILFTKCFADNN